MTTTIPIDKKTKILLEKQKAHTQEEVGDTLTWSEFFQAVDFCVRGEENQ